MTIDYQKFFDNFSKNPDCLITFYLPNGSQVPAHFHVTDVGSVFRHFIDCGGQIRHESYVQIQLWLGDDTDHRLNGETLSKILEQSRAVLNKIPDVSRAEVVMEYKEELTSQYPVSAMEITDGTINVFLRPTETQCLAAIRHERGKLNGASESVCCRGK